MSILKLQDRPKELSFLQAAAAIGQHELMDVYRRFFKARQINCAQLLLTWEDFNDRKRYLNAKNTLLKLIKLSAIPVINENDTVSTDEIRFGDNDRLSALVATLVNADLLIILSDVDGLLDRDKTLIRIVDEITPEIKSLACPTSKKTCVGGMITKIEAAKIAVDSGIPCLIANGRKADIIITLAKDLQSEGTLFVSKRELTAKERWIAFGTKTKGKIFVDDGARAALFNKKSLLSVGITALEGNFSPGDVVSIRDKANSEFARGKAGVSAKELDKVKGTRTDKEAIHRDNIVIL
jgi:glutamate 5-kinase